MHISEHLLRIFTVNAGTFLINLQDVYTINIIKRPGEAIRDVVVVDTNKTSIVLHCTAGGIATLLSDLGK